MGRGNLALRAGALLAGGAFALHQVNYWVIGGGHASLQQHGHTYLPLATALVTVLLLLACASFTRTLWLASRGRHEHPPLPPFRVMWPAMAAALLTIFSLQEWIESWITPAHPSGLGHVVEHVGLTGLGLALLIGAAIAALLRGAESAIAFLAGRRRPRARLRPARTHGCCPPPPALPRLDVLAGKLAGRAPPAVSF